VPGGFVLVLPVQACSDVMVARERVPRELAAGAKGVSDALEHAPPVSPRREVKERPEGAVDEARWLIELEVTHVALAQIERDPCGDGGRTGLREHRR